MAAAVIVPLAIAKAEDGSDLYLYKGAVLPDDGLADGETERLAAGGFTEELPAPEVQADAEVQATGKQSTK